MQSFVLKQDGMSKGISSLQVAYLSGSHCRPHQTVFCDHLIEAHIIVEEIRLSSLNNHLYRLAFDISPQASGTDYVTCQSVSIRSRLECNFGLKRLQCCVVSIAQFSALFKLQSNLSESKLISVLFIFTFLDGQVFSKT